MSSVETDIVKRSTGISPVRDVSYSGVASMEYGEDEERREKPWQRVTSPTYLSFTIASAHITAFSTATKELIQVWHVITRKGIHLYEPVTSVPGALILLLLGVYLLLGYLTQLVEDAMPSVVRAVHVPPDNSEMFSEEAALRYLDQILGTEPRVAGTRYHLTKTQDMKAIVDSIARQATLPVHTDWQFASGDYWLDFNSPHVNCYQNLSNIIAVLEGEAGFHPNGTLGTSVLFNCHYDSVPYALGASDDGVFCAVMVETLSRLSKRTKKFKHNIVFLFNGAEENPLQASHAFLSHPWSKGVTSVVNLEAVGMNGKANVFQVTDARLLAAYARRARRPSAQALGELLFASGLVPSDTDFRIWRDFGNIHGLDIAFVKWGAVYHTRYDHPALLRAGVVQCAGDTLLALAADLADTPGLDGKLPPTASVYYDYLNWFLVSYSADVALAVDGLGVLAGLLSVTYYVWLVGFRMSTLSELCLAAAARLAAGLAGAGAAALGTLLMLATTVQMRYLSEPWIVVPLYWVPYLIGAVSAAHAFDAWRSKKSGLNRSIRALQAMAATRLLMSLVLLVLCCVSSLRSARYVLTVPLLLMAVAACVSITLLRYVRLQAWQHVAVETALSLPCAMFLMSLALRLNALLLPTLGRSVLPAPDALAALVNVGLAALVATPASGLELLFSRRRLWIPAVVLSAVCLVAMLVPLHPYRDDGPATQRHHWFHTEIVSHDVHGAVSERTAGVLVTSQDAYTLRSTAAELQRAGLAVATRRDFREDCERRLFCDLPLYRLRAGRFLAESLFIYMEGPAPFSPPATLRVTSRTCVGELCTLQFVMNGPAHNTLTVWPYKDINLTRWSFDSPLKPTMTHQGRPAYVVIHSTATYSDVFAPLEFTLTFIVPLSLQGAPLADVTHNAHHIAHPELYTSAYSALLAAMPHYFNIASYMSLRSNYII